MLLRRDRRGSKRYVVSWDGLIEVIFHDFHGQLPITVVDFSESGVLLNSKQIFLNSRHLIAAGHSPILILKIFSPEGTFESPVEIRWYDWSVEKRLYEIGVKFINSSEENKAMIHKLLQRVSGHNISEFRIFRFFFPHKTKEPEDFHNHQG